MTLHIFMFMINLHYELDDLQKTLSECYRLLKYEREIAISDWEKGKTEQGPSIELRYDGIELKKQLMQIRHQKKNGLLMAFHVLLSP